MPKITKIAFEFEDGTRKVLTGTQLRDYMVCLFMHSDYLLPVNENSKVVVQPIISGFTPLPRIEIRER